MSCAIRGNNDIKVLKLPGEPDGKELEATISMSPKVFTFSLINDILLNLGFLLRAVQIEIAFVLL
jgi:hypothetical protein